MVDAKDKVLEILARPSQAAKMVFGSDGSATCYCGEDTVASHKAGGIATYLTFAEVSALIFPIKNSEMDAVVSVLNDGTTLSNRTVPQGINIADYKGKQVLMVCDEYIDLIKGHEVKPENKFPGFSLSPSD